MWRHLACRAGQGHASQAGESPPAPVPPVSSPWQTAFCRSQVARTSEHFGTDFCSSWCSLWRWQCPAREPPGWAARGHSGLGGALLSSPSLLRAWAGTRGHSPQLGSASKPTPGRLGSPTYAEDNALQRVLRFTEEAPADLRGGGRVGRVSRAHGAVTPECKQLSWTRPAGETVRKADLQR